MSYEPTVWVDGDHVTSAKLNKLEQGVNSMSYVPTVWSAGDVVTAEKLNKLEQGVAEGGGGVGTIVTVALSTEEAFFNGQPDGDAVRALLYEDGEGWIFNKSLSKSDTSLTIALIEESAYCITVYSEPTVTGDATVKKSELYDEWGITVSGDCTVTT